MSVANTVLSYLQDYSIVPTYVAPIQYAPKFRLIFLAAAFHDFRHSGGVLPDSINIHNAISVFTPNTSEYGLLINACSLEDLSMDLGYGHTNNPTNVTAVVKALGIVTDYIKDTQYPYEGDCGEYGGLLRDLDRLSCMHPDWEVQIYDNLYNELHGDDPTQYVNFCWKQVEFISNFHAYFIPNIKQRLEDSLHNARVIAAKAIL
jgi:hypothetical protein